MVEAMWHVSFTVSNLEKSIEFYTETLKMRLIHKQIQNNEYTSKLVGYEDAYIKVAMLDFKESTNECSGHSIELVEYVNPQGASRELQNFYIGSGHIAFVVSNIQMEFERMKKAGVHFMAGTPIKIQHGRNKGGYSIYFLDPNGITLELVQLPREKCKKTIILEGKG